MKGSILTIAVVLGVVVVSLFAGNAVQILLYLLVGWIPYLFRVLTQVEIRWDAVGLFLVAIVLLSFSVHPLASWLRREMSAQGTFWKWKSTGIVMGSVLVMFVAGIAMVGITHQTYWVISSDRDMLVPTLPGGEASSKLNLKQTGYALLTGQENRPAGVDNNSVKQSWITYSLPYALFVVNIDHQLPWNDPKNQAEARKLVPTLLNPGISPAVLRDRDGYGVSHYAGNSRVFDENERLKWDDLRARQSKTILVGEVNANFQPWAKPGATRDPVLGINRSPDGFGGPDSSWGANFFMADGSVKFFSNDMDPEVLRALSSPTGENE